MRMSKKAQWENFMTDQNNTMSKKTNAARIMKITAVVLLGLLLVLLTVYLFPQIVKLQDEEVRNGVRDFVKDRGAVGVLLMLGVQLIQVVLSVIPGEPVEVLFGFIYGPFAGAALCLAGMTLGSFAVFCATRALGKNFMEKVEQSGKYNKLKFLKDPARRDMLIFILFFLPGTPKDTLTYFAPFTKISLGKFLLISTIGRIPSVITSTFAGESIFAGDYLGSVIIFAVTGAIGLAGIAVYNHIIKRNEKSGNTVTDCGNNEENDSE